jgi:GNAT superfamily N-acetyltransferase
MITIRPLEMPDLRQVSYVHVDTWRTAYRGIVDQELLNKLSYIRSQESWKRCLARMSHSFYVAELDNVLVGFIVGGPQRDEDLLYEAEVYAMYVLPDFQRQRIGRALLVRLVQDFKREGWREFIIWCLKKNPAKAFYEAQGGQLVESAKMKIGGKPLIKNGYLFNTEKYLKDQEYLEM